MEEEEEERGGVDVTVECIMYDYWIYHTRQKQEKKSREDLQIVLGFTLFFHSFFSISKIIPDDMEKEKDEKEEEDEEEVSWEEFVDWPELASFFSFFVARSDVGSNFCFWKKKKNVNIRT